jgi:Ca-activated chloride channel family protein
MWSFEFKEPYVLFLLIPFALFAAFYWYKKWNNRESALPVSSAKLVRGKKNIRTVLYPYLPALRFIAIFFVIIALARPGKGIDYTDVKRYGIDIMIALDVSGSMRAEDFSPNRLTVAKKALRSFIEKRPNDRIGLVIFAGDAYLQSPLTVDHDILFDIVDDLDFDSVSEDGTAIGDALALAASRMTDVNQKGKLIVLLTDGVNNKGLVDPQTAAKGCADMGIKIYSLGIGKEGRVPMPVPGAFGWVRQYVDNQFDENAVSSLSEITGGKFFRAQDSGVFWENLEEIDRLEKTDFNVKQYHDFTDRFMIPLSIAFALFAFEILLRSLVFRKVP